MPDNDTVSDVSDYNAVSDLPNDTVMYNGTNLHNAYKHITHYNCTDETDKSANHYDRTHSNGSVKLACPGIGRRRPVPCCLGMDNAFCYGEERI